MKETFSIDMDLSRLVTAEQAGMVFDQATEEILDYQAEYAQDSVRGFVRSYAKDRTGNYERHVVIDRSRGIRRVHDSDIIYGPWLEGVSGRNQATRYRGMRLWRLTRQDMESSPEIERHSDQVMERHLRGLQ